MVVPAVPNVVGGPVSLRLAAITQMLNPTEQIVIVKAVIACL